MAKAKNSCCKGGVCPACECCICLCTNELRRSLTPESRRLLLQALA